MSTKPATTPRVHTVQENLILLAKTPEFYWALGHVVTLISAISYLFSFRSSGATPEILYRLAYVGVLGSYGLIIYGTVKTRTVKLAALLADNNVQYAFDALIWFFAPRTVLSLAPFILFAIVHVLGFLQEQILPALNYPSTSGLSVRISSLIKNNHERLLNYSANFELILLVVLIFKALIFAKRSWIVLVAYSVFVKLRYESSVYTRSALKAYEVRLDGVLSDPRLPVQVKQLWAKVKSVLRNYVGVPVVSKTK